MRRETGRFTGKSTPSAHRNGPFRPTTAFQMPSVGVSASPWMWAKARSERGALIRLCGDGVVSNVARNGSFYTEINPFVSASFKAILTCLCTYLIDYLSLFFL
jgi:hypothetical protein